MNELSGCHENVTHTRFKCYTDRMRFARLRHHAAINNYFFVDCFPLDLRHLNFGNGSSFLFLVSNSKALRDPGKRAQDQSGRDREDDDSALFHRACKTLFIGR